MQSNPRNCYCTPGDDYCGTCERCGADGHTRHYPGPVPYTGSWCDRCYAKLGRRAVLVMMLNVLFIAAMFAVAGFMIWRMLT